MHLNSFLLFKKYGTDYFGKDAKVLEIGSNGPSPYYNLANPGENNWTTMDLKGIEAAPGWNHHVETEDQYIFPFEANRFDIVVSGQVIEHVRDIYKWLEEIFRIVKPGGHVILINPVSWPYHEAPVDCWRIYPDGMKAIAGRIGYNVVFSRFECLELEHFGYPASLFKIPNYTIPGFTLATDDFKIHKAKHAKLKLNAVLRHIPVVRAFMPPVELAYDTISILQKPI